MILNKNAWFFVSKGVTSISGHKKGSTSPYPKNRKFEFNLHLISDMLMGFVLQYFNDLYYAIFLK